MKIFIIIFFEIKISRKQVCTKGGKHSNQGRSQKFFEEGISNFLKEKI